MRTVLTNVIVVTMNKEKEVISSGFVAWEEDRICGIGSMEDLNTWLCQNPSERSKDKTIDGKRGIVMPGMINLHCHMGMIPFRGLGDDCKDRLRVFLLPMEQQAMNEEMVYASSKFAACELLLSGVTTVFDMYYYEEYAAKAMDEMGMRGFAAESLMETPTCDAADWRDALSYGEELIQKYLKHPRIKVCIAPHATNTCTPEMLEAAYAIDDRYQVPFSLHVAEMDYEMQYFKESSYETPVKYLNMIGALGKNTIAAHAIHLNSDDIELLKQAGASVAHCIGSNTKAAKGVAPVSELRNAGVAVGFGTDGPASGNTLDLFTQMKLCAVFHKNTNHDRSAFPAREIVSMATIEAAKALHMEDQIGSLEVGKQADLVLVETESANMFPVYDPYSALVYSAQPANVEAVYVAGECLVEGKQLKRCELKKVRSELDEIMKKTPFAEYQWMNS